MRGTGSPRTRRPFILTIEALAFAALVLHPSPARAGDEAAAEALFGEAKKLAAAGKYAEACPKFAESNRLDRGAGTLIHLADCYEKNKQSASAWATFKEASSAAQALGRADWQKLAASRAAALEGKLGRLTIRVADPAGRIEVTRDGSPTSSASWGTPIPVDAGPHKIHAVAPGRRAFEVSVTTHDGEATEVAVPALEADTGAPASTSPATGGDAARTSSGSGTRSAGFVIAGIGVAGVAVGAITGLLALGENNDSKKECPTDGACASRAAVDSNDSARTFGTVSTIAFIAGGVGVAVGTVMVLTGGSRGSAGGASPFATTGRSVSFTPATDGRSAGLFATGTF